MSIENGNGHKDRIIVALVAALAGGAGGRAIGATETEARLREAEKAIAVQQAELGAVKASLLRIERRLGTDGGVAQGSER